VTKSAGKRLGTTFHETIGLNRTAVRLVLDVFQKAGAEATFTRLRDETHLGTNYVKATPRWARGCGLLDPDASTLTEFGRLTGVHDPELAEPATQWLMHYHLSSPHGPGPRFWGHLVVQRLRPGDVLAREAMAAEIVTALAEAGESVPGQGALDSSATIFLGTYAKSDGLGGLGVLVPTEERGHYRVAVAPPPPPAALAVALAAYWPAVFGERKTVDLAELTRPGGFFSLFLLGGEAADEGLRALARARVVEVYRVAPPFQVARLWDEGETLLERLYGGL
jgi:hypothetical protein